MIHGGSPGGTEENNNKCIICRDRKANRDFRGQYCIQCLLSMNEGIVISILDKELRRFEGFFPEKEDTYSPDIIQMLQGLNSEKTLKQFEIFSTRWNAIQIRCLINKIKKGSHLDSRDLYRVKYWLKVIKDQSPELSIKICGELISASSKRDSLVMGKEERKSWNEMIHFINEFFSDNSGDMARYIELVSYGHSSIDLSLIESLDASEHQDVLVETIDGIRKEVDDVEARSRFSEIVSYIYDLLAIKEKLSEKQRVEYDFDYLLCQFQSMLIDLLLDKM